MGYLDTRCDLEVVGEVKGELQCIELQGSGGITNCQELLEIWRGHHIS